MNHSNNFHEIQGRIHINAKQKLKKLIESYYFYEFSTKFDICQLQILFQNITNSEIAIINKYEINTENIFIIISFHNTVIVIKKSLIHLLAPLFCFNSKLKLYFTQNTKDVFNQEMKNTNYSNKIQIDCDESINEEIFNFNREISILRITNFEYREMHLIIKTSITRYLIQESYNTLNKEQIVDFTKDFVIKPTEEKKIKIEKWKTYENEYIELKNIGSGYLSDVKLVYQIENKRLYAIKMQNNIKQENKDYLTREYKNYLLLDYPLLPKLYNVYEYENRYYLKIQFIKGQTLLDNAKSGQLQNLTIDDKIFIILQLILIFNYLHEKGFVYRDLKTDNVIVDENKNVFVIDFDRMISEKTGNLNEEDHTKDFSHEYVAPEVNLGIITPKNDIYSLGKIIQYILNNELLDNGFKSLFDENPNNRPSISYILYDFNIVFQSRINNLLIKYTPEIQYYQGIIHMKYNIKSAIHYYTLAANQNHPEAQYDLGLIFLNDKYITRDINKSIYYFTLAANQNYSNAQYNLGVIYYDNKYTTFDINKSIHYLTLAANQNDLRAQFQLGLIYEEGQYITRNINKSIHYYTLAANQNHPKAKFQLGLIYLEGQNITQDISKSIYYIKLAANQNHLNAQYNLGLMYFLGEYIKQDINKSIHYFTLAANQNYPNAQFQLGLIYSDDKYITHNINKSIYYYTLAANQNHLKAQFNLGLMYFLGECTTRDINKSIHYFTLAANQKYSNAQYNLGVIYYFGKYIARDINKSIHYLTLAANQNDPKAQFLLGLIYYDNKYIARDINKSIHYYTLSANQNHPQAQFQLGMINLIQNNTNRGLNLLDKSSSTGDIKANFVIGYLYHEGKYLDRNMSKCIKHYKYASSFNNIHSKNNLGVIYKNGIGDEIPKNIGYAIEYFKEAVQRWEDELSMYNLSHIYIYEIKKDEKINESIELLIKSSNKNFEPSKYLLCIALIKKHNFDLEQIRNELTEKSNNLVKPINEIILELNLIEKSVFLQFEKKFESFDYLYGASYNYIQSKYALTQKNVKNNGKLKNISQKFYDGFGDDI